MLSQSLYSEEELGLFNSAYTGFILYSSISEFVVFKQEGMHCALPFLLLPMSMNQLVSSQLPSTYKTPIMIARNGKTLGRTSNFSFNVGGFLFLNSLAAFLSMK